MRTSASISSSPATWRVRFNARYGETLTVPDAYVRPGTAKILDLTDPSAKMSKSLPDAGTLYLLDDPARRDPQDQAGRHRRRVGDPLRPEQQPGVSNLVAILAAVTASTPDKVVERVRRLGLRRAQDGHGRGRRRVRRAVRPAYP